MQIDLSVLLGACETRLEDGLNGFLASLCPDASDPPGAPALPSKVCAVDLSMVVHGFAGRATTPALQAFGATRIDGFNDSRLHVDACHLVVVNGAIAFFLQGLADRVRDAFHFVFVVEGSSSTYVMLGGAAWFV